MTIGGVVPGASVRWVELKPEEFLHRLDARPVAYLPMGMVEPHGHAAAFGLDMIKAEYLCDEAAARFGGIVAPSQAYHIHETASTEPGCTRSWVRSTRGSPACRLTSSCARCSSSCASASTPAFVPSWSCRGRTARRATCGRLQTSS